MKRCLILLLVSGLLIAFSAASYAAADINFSVKPFFGKVTYKDADTNGFSNATWLGMQLTGEKILSPSWKAQAIYQYGISYDAVAPEAGWNLLDPNADPAKHGKVRNDQIILDMMYVLGEQGEVGIGYLGNYFKETEYGFAETRDYLGVCFMGDWSLPIDQPIKLGFIYAPSLNTRDHSKGDWNDPNRSAWATYGGSFWQFDAAWKAVSKDNFDLSLGMSYSRLHGDGQDNPDYRFLAHNLTQLQFNATALWRF